MTCVFAPCSRATPHYRNEIPPLIDPWAYGRFFIWGGGGGDLLGWGEVSRMERGTNGAGGGGYGLGPGSFPRFGITSECHVRDMESPVDFTVTPMALPTIATVAPAAESQSGAPPFPQNCAPRNRCDLIFLQRVSLLSPINYQFLSTIPGQLKTSYWFGILCKIIFNLKYFSIWPYLAMCSESAPFGIVIWMGFSKNKPIKLPVCKAVAGRKQQRSHPLYFSVIRYRQWFPSLSPKRSPVGPVPNRACSQSKGGTSGMIRVARETNFCLVSSLCLSSPISLFHSPNTPIWPGQLSLEKKKMHRIRLGTIFFGPHKQY